MEVGNNIREQRERAGISQEDLAQKIFVSRQTVSNWETSKTYPDVQSLLLLSNLFGVPVDSLVKGDVEAMEKELQNYEMDRFKVRAAWVLTWVLILVGLTMMALLFASDISLYSPLWILAQAITWSAVVVALWSWNIERKYDIKTYREVRAFLAGEAPDAIERTRKIPDWARNLIHGVLGAAIGVALVVGIMFVLALLGVSLR